MDGNGFKIIYWYIYEPLINTQIDNNYNFLLNCIKHNIKCLCYKSDTLSEICGNSVEYFNYSSLKCYLYKIINKRNNDNILFKGLYKNKIINQISKINQFILDNS